MPNIFAEITVYNVALRDQDSGTPFHMCKHSTSSRTHCSNPGWYLYIPLSLCLVQRSGGLEHTCSCLADDLLQRGTCETLISVSKAGFFKTIPSQKFLTQLLDLSKLLLDPLDNDDFYNDSVNMDIPVLIRESNSGSTRWSQGAKYLPF